MNKIKTSKIWAIPKAELQAFCNKCYSIRELLQLLDYSPNSGTMFYKLKERINEDNIDISHFGTKHSEKCGKIPLSEILTTDSLYNRSKLKKRLVKEGLLEYKCNQCGNKGVWNSKPMTLQLEHINGIPTDNRIENLTFLCPNCHSQTLTYAGRNTVKS